jgi:thiol-disulfide isomerase/thioredoxin
MKYLIMRSIIVYLIVLPLFALAVSCSEKHHVVEGKVKGIGDVQVYLHAFDGKDIKIVDSVKSNKDVFVFQMKPERLNGMYHVRWGKGPADGIDIIYNYQDVKFSVPKDSLHLLSFDASNENELFMSFYPIRLTIHQLTNLGDQMNKADPIGNKQQLIELNIYLDSLEYAVHQMFDDMDAESQKLLAFKVMRTAFYPNYDYELAKGRTTKQDPFVFMQHYFFSYVDFTEPALIRTPFIHQAIEDYLNLYVYPHSMEKYKSACDMIVSKAAVNDDMYDYVVNLLVRTFESSDYWELYLYLMETYLPEVCADGDNYGDKTLLYEIVKKSRPGSPATDIAGVSPDGRTLSLKADAHGKAIVLLFWDPDCGHCKMIINQLVTVWPAYEQRGLEVVAFCLTKKKDEWIQAVDVYNMGEFVNMSDLKDTESVTFDKYHIRGTPEIYVIDENFTIFSRPVNYIQLDRDIMQLLDK